MITKDNIKDILTSDFFGFHEERHVYTKEFGDGDDKFSLSYNFGSGEFHYPEGVVTDRNTTIDDHQNESFVTFLCIAQLFEVGYKPNNIKLEVKNFQGQDLGWIDILVSDNNGKEYLIIECKTADVASKTDEFRKHWAKTLRDGDQLFRYFNTYRRAQYLCLFSADYPGYKKNGKIHHQFENIYNIISLVDNDEYLKTDPKLDSFKNKRRQQGGSEDFFKVWKNTYLQDYNTRGLLEKGIEPFKIGRKSYNIHDLKVINEYSLGKKYNEFALILRKHTISSHENAFDKLVNLFIAKIIDEKRNPKDLKLLWKGAAYDDYFSLQDRLNVLYREGMKEFFDDDVTYIENQQIEDAFKFLSSKADEGKETIKRYFRKLKYFNNNPFAFLDVHNEQLFFKNAVILKDVINMLQDIYLTSNENNQFLGDLFESFLNKGVHQSEGQFFSPIPIVRFLVSSLPLKSIIDEVGIPGVLDYACGAGHFLTEYAQEIQPIIKQENSNLKDEDLRNLYPNYFKKIVGIEKDYRLSKVSQVAAFMYGMDGIQIHFGDGLVDIPGIKEHSFNIIVANPPYAVSGFLETLSEEERKKYQLTDYVSNIEKNNTIETFFVERASQMLASGGVAAIILPSSVLNKGGIYMHMREIVLKYFDIVAICNFGPSTFGQTSTSTVTLFLRRKPIEPDTSLQVKNRVDTWFSGNFDDDEFYKDKNILDSYVECMGYTKEDYIKMLHGELTKDFMKTDMVKDYSEALNIPKKGKNSSSASLNADAKEIRDKAQKEYKKDPTPTKRLNALLDFVRAIEKEKLYYYMLAALNPQPVVIVQSPLDSKNKPDKDKEEKFLGYEWSNRKGNEGIHYLNTGKLKKDSENGEDEDDDTISQITSIDGIQTPLFNPQNLFDDKKINTIIRNNFEKADIEIQDEQADFVSQYSLIDLIDFSRTEFDKVIKTTPILSYPSFQTSFPTKRLGDIAPYVTEKINSSSIEASHYVTTENMLQDRKGIIKFNGEIGNFSITKFKKGDILVSNIRPYLKKIWMADFDGGCSNDVLVFRNTDTSILNEYLYYILSSDLFFSYCMTGKTGVKMPRGDKKIIPRFEIPVPILDIQKHIVEESKLADRKVLDKEKDLDLLIKASNILFNNSKHNAHQTIKLSNTSLFDVSIGRRVLKSEISTSGEFEVYSANVYEPFGKCDNSVLSNFDVPSIIWGIDGDWMVNYIPKGILFNPTDHCGVIRVLDESIVNPRYLTYALEQAGIIEGFSRTKRASTERIKALSLNLPSIDTQNDVAERVLENDVKIKHLQLELFSLAHNKQAILDKYLK